jgi:hypothetical protein
MGLGANTIALAREKLKMRGNRGRIRRSGFTFIGMF